LICARSGLWKTLTEWAQDYRLTDATGSRNRWVVEVALETLREWAETHPDQIESPEGLQWTLPETGIGNRLHSQPAFRRRRHLKPGRRSQLGPLARDFVWLARYVCTEQ